VAYSRRDALELKFSGRAEEPFVPQISKFGLDKHGIINNAETIWNEGPERLYEATIRAGLGTISEGGALSVETGK